MFKECDKTLFCIFLNVYFPGLSLFSAFILLAVFMDAPPNTSNSSTMINTPGSTRLHLELKTDKVAHISWSSPTPLLLCFPSKGSSFLEV